MGVNKGHKALDICCHLSKRITLDNDVGQVSKKGTAIFPRCLAVTFFKSNFPST